MEAAAGMFGWTVDQLMLDWVDGMDDQTLAVPGYFDEIKTDEDVAGSVAAFALARFGEWEFDMYGPVKDDDSYMTDVDKQQALRALAAARSGNWEAVKSIASERVVAMEEATQ